MQGLIPQFMSFATIGVVATALHYAVLIALVEIAAVSPVRASAAGALAGAFLSYGLNRFITFRSSAPHTTTVSRFFCVAAIALAINTALMALFTELLTLPYLLAQVITTGLIVIITFGANKWWTFKDDD